jgi:hypothetical protein
MRLTSFQKNRMITPLIIAAFSLFTATARPADPGRALPPPAPTNAAPSSTPLQIPLLFIIDGVRYESGKQPALSSDQIFAVRVIKGTAAIRLYGRDASYGVVLIITKQAAGPRA